MVGEQNLRGQPLGSGMKLSQLSAGDGTLLQNHCVEQFSIVNHCILLESETADRTARKLTTDGTGDIWVAADTWMLCGLTLLGRACEDVNRQHGNGRDQQSQQRTMRWFSRLVIIMILSGRSLTESDPRIQDSKSQKKRWRRGWDSNPRNGFPFTAFPVLPIQPLLHLSKDQKLNKGRIITFPPNRAWGDL